VRRSLRRVAMNTVTTAELIAGTGFDPEVRARQPGKRFQPTRDAETSRFAVEKSVPLV
jgi:hypothetical protein